MSLSRSPLAILRCVPVLAVSLAPAMAFAHPGVHESSALLSGLAHPLSGWDHVLALVAIALWATQNGGRARWWMPAVFVAAMSCGGLLAWAGMELPGVEWGIGTSVLVWGAIVAVARRLPPACAATFIGAFAICHGYAHAMEMPIASDVETYMLGLAITSTLLMTGSIVAAARVARISPRVIRIIGSAVALSGVGLLFA